MTAVLQATGLGKRYRRTWALRDCSVAIPEGRVVARLGRFLGRRHGLGVGGELAQ